MDVRGWAWFDTSLGRCGVAWGTGGVRVMLLPPADTDAARARLRRHGGGGAPGTPPPAVARAVDGVRALLGGQAVDLRDVALDWDGVAEFDRQVWTAARDVPPGRTTTYGAIADRLGGRHLARAVGQALARNRFAPVVPCHRVLAVGGRSGGFSAPGGVDTKRRMLQIERARVGDGPGLFDGD